MALTLLRTAGYPAETFDPSIAGQAPITPAGTPVDVTIAAAVIAAGASVGISIVAVVPGMPAYQLPVAYAGTDGYLNGMGGTPLIELYVVANELAKILRGRDITIARSLIGSYITSLEMAGCSITLLRLDDELTRYWDAPVHTPALRWGV